MSGGRVLTLVVVFAPEGRVPLRVALAGDRFVLGREPDDPGGLRVADGGASRVHARLRRGARGAWRLVDLGSTNGTLVDGVRVSGRKSAAVAHGTVIRVARTLLVADAGSAGPGAPLAARKHELLERAAAVLQRGTALTASAAEALLLFGWPGGEPELARVLRAAAVRAGVGPLGLEHLPDEIAGPIVQRDVVEPALAALAPRSLRRR